MDGNDSQSTREDALSVNLSTLDRKQQPIAPGKIHCASVNDSPKRVVEETSPPTSPSKLDRNDDSDDDDDDSDTDTDSPPQLPQPVWTDPLYTKKSTNNVDSESSSMGRYVAGSGGGTMGLLSGGQPSTDSRGIQTVLDAGRANDSLAGNASKEQDTSEKEREERQAAALQIVREARRQSHWSSRAAEEKANREREEAERRREEAELARETERKREEALKRAEEEKRLLIEARKREDLAKRKVSCANLIKGVRYRRRPLVCFWGLGDHTEG